jgi:(E)-4-hydroxy-3-methylbut-2-enyl-diphosphate synthase
MLYLNGNIAHKQAIDGIIDEMVARVEQTAAELEAARAAETAPLVAAE